MTPEPKKPGRPEGSTITYRTSLKQEMLATSKLNKEMRELSATMVREIKKAAESGVLNLDEKLKIVQTLTSSLQNQARSQESIAKVLAAVENASGELGGSEDSSPEDVLREMTGRRV